MIETQWHVITGAPCSGITSLGNYLRMMGFKVIPEVARGIIDIGKSNNMTLDEIRGDQVEFERKIVAFQHHIEKQLSPHKTIFIERGLPDCVAYGLDPEHVKKASFFKYQNIFVLENLNFEKDYARPESYEQAIQLGKDIIHSYEDFGYTNQMIKKDTIHNRAMAILHKTKQKPPIDLKNPFSS